jgi:hypothetical protein
MSNISKTGGKLMFSGRAGRLRSIHLICLFLNHKRFVDHCLSFFRSLYYLSYFDLKLLINLLISSNFYYPMQEDAGYVARRTVSKE